MKAWVERGTPLFGLNRDVLRNKVKFSRSFMLTGYTDFSLFLNRESVWVFLTTTVLNRVLVKSLSKEKLPTEVSLLLEYSSKTAWLRLFYLLNNRGRGRHGPGEASPAPWDAQDVLWSW